MFRVFLTSFIVTTLMLVSGIAGAATSSSSTAGKTPLRIAMIDPLSGAFANLGVAELALFRFEANRLNKEGGINGHPIEIVPLDNKLDPKQALVQFQKAADDGIHYVLQANADSIASALLNAVNKHNTRNPNDLILYLNYGAIGPEFTNQRCSFWHFLFDDNTKMKMNILTDWIAKQKDIKKVFLFNQDYGFGHDVSEYAREMLKKKRPDIKIAGNVYVPLGKVKDFSPYIAEIKASGADAVITGNWGPDMSLLAKAASSSGLKIPFMTYYASLPGTPTEMGKNGVGIVHMVSIWNGDYSNPELAKRQVAMKKQTHYDYGFIQEMYALDMLRQAAAKAHSIEPTKVAFALENLHFDGPMGTAIMRGKDHQLLAPTFISVFKDGMKYSIENTDHLNFHAIDKYSAEQTALPTTCHMRNRPKQ